MSNRLFCIVVFCVNLAAVTQIFAEEKAKPQAKPKQQVKPQPQPGGAAEVMKKYDLDKNKTINLSEAEAIQKSYKENPQDPSLKKYDTDKDGGLSDAEIMKISPAKVAPKKPKAGKPKPGNPKKGKKK